MADGEWNALVESLKILASRPNWVDMLLKVCKDDQHRKMAGCPAVCIYFFQLIVSDDDGVTLVECYIAIFRTN